ncbi:mRNA capping enzyme, alpha subunit [Rickenella mellea]|uniref:mRNA-capping enzyme subunit alpha n=1 Tax=Rickenella mellea TaxID=50990 RepID=A0A4Y7QJ79_9AGAM|nr:mRNA capping enzyme, alpha subunit [Rickenella mellea]
MHESRVPDLPGELVPHDQAEYLKDQLANFCQLTNTKFPGSQPVSFSQSDLDRLENEDYWVCEKSDGVRVLMFIHTNLETNDQATYILDRLNHYRLQTGLYFPHHENPRMPLRSTVLDGELVIDVDPRTKQETLRFLAFDCLIVDNQNVMSRPLDKRYGRLKEWFYKPYSRMIRDHPHMLQNQPFDIKVKDMNFSYGVDKVFNEDIPRLQHGNDGLIYTCAQSPYVTGTDPKILKWKPPSENSIDFKLVLRFPPVLGRHGEPDYHAKPIFGLHVYTGGDKYDKYEPFDEMFMEDSEWERLKDSGEQIDDRIVEVHWEPRMQRWRMMRFRDDKPHGNFHGVVDNIIQSIKDGVEKEDLLARSNAIRTAWKARQGVQARATTAPQNQQPPPSQPQRLPQPPPLPIAKADLHYGPLQESRYSRVGGPAVVLGFNR